MAKLEGARGQLKLIMTVCRSWHRVHRGWEIECEHGSGALAGELCTDSHGNQLLPVNTRGQHYDKKIQAPQSHITTHRGWWFYLATVYNNVRVKLE